MLKILAEQIEIRLIAAAVGQVDIEITGRLFERIIILLMHRESANGAVASENVRCPVAVVHIEVHRHGTPDLSFRLQLADGDCHVMQHAEAFSMLRKSVVKTAAEVYA